MSLRRIGQSDLNVFPLCLGGNVFGWTADEADSFGVLDAYVGGGGNFIDTADSYSAWAPGHVGGESETILGRWMTARGTRNRVLIATKVGSAPGLKGLAARTIQQAAEASLRRLATDRIDLYYAHVDDPATPLEDSLRAFDSLVNAGKVRYVAASNITASRLADALATSDREGLARYVAVQPNYNLMHRAEYESDLRALCARERLACVPYFALAQGFLTGKYRVGTKVDSARAAGASQHLNARGLQALAELDAIASAHRTTVAAVSLAWLAAQPTVAAPIASARTVDQLADLLPMADIQLTAAELARLGAV